MQADFGKVAADYATHRAGFPDAFFDGVLARGWAGAGQRLLDLGTGTGTVARGFAARGLTVTALDPDRRLMDQGARLAAAAGVDIVWAAGSAETTGQPEGAFDLITAGQCWHWFDRPAALAECRRVLHPGGRLLICYFDWLPITGPDGAANMVARSEALIRDMNPDWTLHGTTGLYPHYLPELSAAGFTDIETASFDHDQPYSPDAWVGRLRASAGVGGSLPDDKVAEFDRRMRAEVLADFPGDPLLVPHRIWMATAVAPG